MGVKLIGFEGAYYLGEIQSFRVIYATIIKVINFSIYKLLINVSDFTFLIDCLISKTYYI